MSDEESGYCGKFFGRYGSSNTCQNKIKDINEVNEKDGKVRIRYGIGNRKRQVFKIIEHNTGGGSNAPHYKALWQIEF